MSAKNKLYYIVLFFYALLTNAQKLQIPSSTNHIKDVEFILDQEKSFGSDTTALKKFLQPLQNISNYKVLYDGLLANGYSDFYDSVNKSSNKYYLRSIKKAKNSKNSSLQIWAQLNYISYLYHYRDYINLTPILLEVIAAIETLPKNQIIAVDDSFKKIGWIMHTYGDYHTSIRYLEAAEKTADKNTSEYTAIINAIGLNYFYLGNDKRAATYLNKTAELATKIHDEVRYAKALGDLALISRKKGDLKTASEILEKDKSYIAKSPYEMSGRSFRLIDPLKTEENFLWAEKALQKSPLIIEPFFNRKWDFSHYVFPDGKVICYENKVDEKFQYKGSVFHNEAQSVENLSSYASLEKSEWDKFQNALQVIIAHYKNSKMNYWNNFHKNRKFHTKEMI